jgi:hypothetical protein
MYIYIYIRWQERQSKGIQTVVSMLAPTNESGRLKPKEHQHSRHSRENLKPFMRSEQQNNAYSHNNTILSL